MDEKKKIYAVIMESNDDDYGQEFDSEVFGNYEDAKAYWKQHVDTELHDDEMSWAADAYDNGDFDPKEYELIKTENYFSFELRGWNKYVTWSIEEKEVLKKYKLEAPKASLFAERTGGWKINPLPLLTASSNGRGGGDYFPESGFENNVGAWVNDLLEVKWDKPENYEEVQYFFREQ